MNPATVYEVVTDRIISKLESGVVPWRRPWSTLGACQNLVTKNDYQGINAWTTAISGFSSPFFLTYKQAKALGGHVKAGEKGLPILFFGKYEKESPESESPESFLVARYYTVFNIEQCEGIEAPQAESPRTFIPIESAQSIVQGMPQAPRIQHAESKAYYSPHLDFVNMPRPESFITPEDYYSTLFHELGHSTGHETRLKRESLTKIAAFGSHEYSKEELVAEFTAAFLCNASGITNTLDNSAAYLAGWLKVLKNDRRLLVSAASQAQKSSDFILNKKPTT